MKLVSAIFSVLQSVILCTVHNQSLQRAAKTVKDEYLDDLTDAFLLHLISHRATTTQVILLQTTLYYLQDFLM